MKSGIVFICILGLYSARAFSQSPAEKELYQRLAKGPDKVKALETVLKTPDEYSALILYFGAHVAFNEKRVEDSAFLFYAAQLRARFDRVCFPPQQTGGNSPFTLLGALSQQLGSAINPAVMAEPKAFLNAIERVRNWTPKASKEYRPGYEFTERLSEKDAIEAAKPNRTEFLDRMGDLATLLNDPEYFAAFKIIQAYNLGQKEKQPTKEERDKATETMKQIEQKKGLKGYFSK